MPENITSLLPSVLLWVHSTSNNANGNKWVIFFSGTAWYYGDNDFIIRTFDSDARLDTVHVTCSAWTDSHMTCSTDTDSHMIRILK